MTEPVVYATTPSTHRTMGLSIHYAPCIAATATNASGGTGDLSDLVESYQHQHSANNGFDTAQIVIKGQWKWIENWWFEGLARDIQVFNPDLNTVWRGFVNSVSLSVGPLSAARGPLTDVATYAFTVYTRILDDTVNPPIVGSQTVTTAATDPDSIARYGQWEKVLSGGTVIKDTAERYRDTHIAENHNPPSSELLNFGASTEVQLTIDCLGYWAWLQAYTYSDATAGTRTISTKLQDILTSDPNGIFSTNYAHIETNSYLASREESDYPSALTVIQAETAIGDIYDNRFTFGIWEDQVARYREVSTLKTQYEHFLTDDKMRVATFGGGTEVPYWNVRADEWLFIADFLEGQAPDTVNRRDDDRFIFIERVNYTMPDGLSINGMRIGNLAQFLAKQGLGGTA